MSEQKSEWVRKLEAKIEQADARLDLLRAKAKEADADTRAAIEREVSEMEERRDHATDRLKEIKEAGGDAWDDVVRGTKDAWDKLTDAMDRARDRFD